MVKYCHMSAHSHTPRCIDEMFRRLEGYLLSDETNALFTSLRNYSPRCKKQMQATEYEQHRKEECLRRERKCEHCKSRENWR